MTIDELFEILNANLIRKISTHQGLANFARRKAKFEGWLKGEVIDNLVTSGYNALPEIDCIDVLFDNIGIELKTVSTNYNFPNVVPLIKPITDNINGIIRDISWLQMKNLDHRFIIFIAFPCVHGDDRWRYHFDRINDLVFEMRLQEFQFVNQVPGVMYVAKV